MSRWTRSTPNVATIDDVARLAGVSSATVSRVVNGETNVREATRKVVAAAISELNYVPNLAARSLASANQLRLGVICSNPSAAYLSAFLLGAMDESTAKGIELVVARCDAGDEVSERAAMERLVNSAVSGVLLPASRSDVSTVPSLLREFKIPTVAIGAGRASQDFSRVRVDDQVAAREMTEYLLSLGHRRIGFIKGIPNLQASMARELGFTEAMNAVEGAEASVTQGQFTFESGLSAAERLLDGPSRPTAIFASNDDMAAAVISVAHRRRIDVPRDLSVVGFDDTQIAVTLWPPLTTVRQPFGPMAAKAIEMLSREIRLARAGGPLETTDEIVPHVRIERRSSAPPFIRARPRIRALNAQAR